MELLAQLPDGRRERAEARLRADLIAWLTTVRPDGQPVSVPVWFLLLDDGKILVYSQPAKTKLRNIVDNPKVSLTLDGTDTGQDIVRVEGTIQRAEDYPAAQRQPAYLAKYRERIDSTFGTPEKLAEMFSTPLLITPTKVHAWS